MNWEHIDDYHCRAKVYGGWLIKVTSLVLTKMHEGELPTDGYEWRESICFMPDQFHQWKPEEYV